MKKISCAYIIVLSVLVISCKNHQKPTSGNSETAETTETQMPESFFLISDGQVGNFKIGGKIPTYPKFYERHKTQKTRFTDAGKTVETRYIFSKNDKRELILLPQYDKPGLIGEIWVLSEKYRTGEDVGVGSSIKEFQKAYPNFKLWYTYVSDRYVLENAKSAVQFLLDEQDFIGTMNVQRVKMPLKATDFKKVAKIEKIRLYRE